MSLARAVQLARQRPAAAIVSRRNASSSAHSQHEDHHDSEQYPSEGFSGPFWRNTVLASVLAVAAYKYAPEPTDDAYLTRWIALYTPSRDQWLDMAAKHTALSVEESETTLLVTSAKKPPVHRFRYPHLFEQKSPFLTPVGDDIDTNEVVVKGQ
ncbi:hypothetical protein LshimejAT787_0402720 [Lyophyllum shimeji]|uniref:Uncharacterized protein n=1 Tax=Lyophyllum shimeji TaxID=47721 RepID=A0A9P3PK63_LYOSH|nr:hypothetical protein LshimejAT787_0402720 [Lyophyllum shimeji]